MPKKKNDKEKRYISAALVLICRAKGREKANAFYQTYQFLPFSPVHWLRILLLGNIYTYIPILLLFVLKDCLVAEDNGNK